MFVQMFMYTLKKTIYSVYIQLIKGFFKILEIDHDQVTDTA